MSSLADMLFRDGIQMTALQAGIELCQSCGEAPVEASGFCENCLDVLAELRHADQDEGGQRPWWQPAPPSPRPPEASHERLVDGPGH